MWRLFVILLLSVGSISSQSIPRYENVLRNDLNTNISENCLFDLRNITNGLINFEPWAWKMVDSSSHIPTGILTGNIIEMGNYDECLSVGTEASMETKFCKAAINFAHTQIMPKKMKINTAAVGASPDLSILDGVQVYMCIPKTCSAEDMQMLFQDNFKFKNQDCVDKEEKSLDGLAISAIIFFSLVGCIAIFSTIYDLFMEFKMKSAPHPAAKIFSFYTNGKKLFSMGNKQEFECLNGLKSISMMWVVLGHIYMTYLFVPLKNYVDVWNWLQSAHSQYITGATVSVDTFLVIGGFLTIYSFNTAMDKGVKFNIPLYYFHRYLRLTPSLAAMLFAHVALFNYFGNGPLWENTDIYLSRGCKKYWWSTLLYIQNYVNPNEICIPQSWYLSVDMQLFLISPIFLIALRKYPVWGYLLLSATCLGSIIGGYIVAWNNELSGVITVQGPGGLVQYMQYYYMPTHTRMVPYLFGIMLGFLVYKIKKNEYKIKMNNTLIIMLWTISMALLFIGVFGGQNIQNKEYNKLESSFFIALIRPTWAFGVCWVIFACVMGWGGPINSILSWKLFQIFSRISYSIYMVHYSFLFMTSFSSRQSLLFSDYNAVHKFWGDFMFVAVISVFWTLLFESPVIVLEKLLLGGKPKPKKQPPQSEA